MHLSASDRIARTNVREAGPVAALYAIHLVLLWLLINGTLAFLFNDAAHRYGPGTDFFAYYKAAWNWIHGNGIYGHGPGFGFRYHPLCAMILFAPLTLLKPYAAYYVWVAINELLLLIDLLVLRKLLPIGRKFPVAAALLLLFTPLLLELYMGNASLAVASILLMAFYYYGRGAILKFTILTTISVIIKPIALIFVPMLLLRRNWKSVLFVVAVPVLTAVPYFVLDPEGWRQFAVINFGDMPVPGWYVHAGNQGLWCLLVDMSARLSGVSTHRLAGPGQLPLMTQAGIYALPLVLGLLTLWLTWRLRHNWPALVFIWSAGYLLGYKDVWEHSYSFLALGLAFLYLSNLVNGRLVLVCSIGLALPTAFALYDVGLPAGPHDPEHHWPLWIAALHHTTKPFWVLLLYVACTWQALQRRAIEPRASQ